MMAPLNESDSSNNLIHVLGYYSAALCIIGTILVIARWHKTFSKAKRLFVMMVIFSIGALVPANSALLSRGIYQNLNESRLLYSVTLGMLSLLVISLVEFGWQKRMWKIPAVLALVVLVVVWVKKSDPEPGPDTRGYIFDYDQESGLLRLVKEP